MSDFYGEHHRQLQQQFDTAPLAERLEQLTVKPFLDDQDQAFVASREMFFLSTIDHAGRPTVSYKGGDPGFVSVVDERTLVFPSYDGNGMFLSMGNIVGNPQIGMLFIDFEHPHRLRLQGTASVSADDPLLESFPGAEAVVRVDVQQSWVNCPRYIHRHRKVGRSEHVPREGRQAPLADWKRIDVMQDVLPAKDVGRPEQEGGVISVEEYTARYLTPGD